MKKHTQRLFRTWSPSVAAVAALLLVVVLGTVSKAEAQDFVGNASSDIIWRWKSNGDNWIWEMNGTNHVANYKLPSALDTMWRIAGSGYFNSDTNRDILWQHETSDLNAIWFVDNTKTNLLTTTSIQSTGDTNWRMVGTADFDGNGHTDILWQYRTTAQPAAVWFMGSTWGTNVLAAQLPPYPRTRHGAFTERPISTRTVSPTSYGGKRKQVRCSFGT